ncbi:hypothetical protein D3C85_1785640 [compost metagenome]
MAGAQLLGLQRPGDVRVLDLFAHLLAAVTVHHHDLGRLQLAGGRDHARQHRLAADRVQHLGQGRIHTLAFAGSQNDNAERVHEQSR